MLLPGMFQWVEMFDTILRLNNWSLTIMECSVRCHISVLVTVLCSAMNTFQGARICFAWWVVPWWVTHNKHKINITVDKCAVHNIQDAIKRELELSVPWSE